MSKEWSEIITRKGGPIFPWILLSSYAKKLDEFLGFHIDYEQIMVCSKGKFSVYTKPKRWRKVEEIFEKKINEDPNFFENIIRKFEKRRKRLEKLAKRKIKGLDPSKLANFLDEFTEVYRDVCPFYIFYYGLEPVLRKSIENWLKQTLAEEKAYEFFVVLSTPTKAGFLIEEEIEIRKIVNRIRKDSKLKNLFDKNPEKISKLLKKLSPRVNEMIEKHVKKYYWIPVERVAAKWDRLTIIKRIRSMIKEREKTIDFLKEIKEKQRRYEKSIKITQKMKRKILMIRKLVESVDLMKKSLMVADSFLLDLLHETSKITKAPKKILLYLSPPEVIKLLTGIRYDQNEVMLRKELCVMIIDQSQKFDVQIMADDDAERIVQELKEEPEELKVRTFKGIPASLGKKEGTVKIIEDVGMLRKLKPGEILVARETTPDFVIAIRKASAIITDEGGLTSHAAIVSREYGIPCIVGTGIATKVLKDGDRVIVDATKGTVEKVG